MKCFLDTTTCRIFFFIITLSCFIRSAIFVEGRRAVEQDTDSRVLRSDWSQGDVFVGASSGVFKVFSNTGVFKETIQTGISALAHGCVFDSNQRKLYTSFYGYPGKVVVLDAEHPHAVWKQIDAPGSGTEPVFDAAGKHFYVGLADSDDLDDDNYADDVFQVRKYNATKGTWLKTYYPATEKNQAADRIRIHLSTDQCTLYYYSWSGRLVKRYNVCNDTQLSDFVTLSETVFANTMRLLSPEDGAEGLLMAGDTIRRFDETGKLVQTYGVDGEYYYTGLSLDPDGTSFWAGSLTTNKFYRFDIASGRQILGPIDAGVDYLTALCVLGEVTALSPCSDGHVQLGEACDDGNTVNGDGCSSTCQLEERSCRRITYNLYNSQTDTLAAPLTNGTTIANPPPCRLRNIAAVLPCKKTAHNVTLELYRGSRRVHQKTERRAPYFLFGNQGRNVWNGTIVPGPYGIRARVDGGAWSPFTNFTLGGGRCV